jgi:hypothetical protein
MSENYINHKTHNKCINSDGFRAASLCKKRRLGASWGIGMLFLGWISILGWGIDIVKIISSLYIGFAPSFLGGIIGGVWGFTDGAVGGLIIAIVYNAVIKKK